MNPATIYKIGKRLKVDIVFEPEIAFDITVNEKEATRLVPGRFYDFIRILTMFCARQYDFLSYKHGKSVKELGDRILTAIPVTNQLDLFLKDTEQLVEAESTTASSTDGTEHIES